MDVAAREINSKMCVLNPYCSRDNGLPMLLALQIQSHLLFFKEHSVTRIRRSRIRISLKRQYQGNLARVCSQNTFPTTERQMQG
jgi:hypothetical protein